MDCTMNSAAASLSKPGEKDVEGGPPALSDNFEGSSSFSFPRDVIGSAAPGLAGASASFSFPRASNSPGTPTPSSPPHHMLTHPGSSPTSLVRRIFARSGRSPHIQHETDPLLPPGRDTSTEKHFQRLRSCPSSYSHLPLVNECGAFNLDIRGMPKLKSYYNDLFHTLINVPNMRFYPLLAVAYALLFGVFAVPYYLEAISDKACIPGVKNYLHAMWFSVQTSMTIGFGGDLTPHPSCTLVNFLIAVQSVCSLLVAYSLLGVVYARFSLPTRRESTMVFSKSLVLNEVGGTPLLSCRVANIRKHQLIEVTVRMLLSINNILTEENESIFRFTQLPVLGGNVIFLALPCTVSHAIGPHSPLHGMSLGMMERADMEVIVLLEGVDASTSAKVQARHSYFASDIVVNHRFGTMVSRASSGRRIVDFTKFNELIPVPKVYTKPDAMLRTPSHTSMGTPSSVGFANDVPVILQYPTEVTLDKHGAIAGKRHGHGHVHTAHTSLLHAHGHQVDNDRSAVHGPGLPPIYPRDTVPPPTNAVAAPAIPAPCAPVVYPGPLPVSGSVAGLIAVAETYGRHQVQQANQDPSAIVSKEVQKPQTGGGSSSMRRRKGIFSIDSEHDGGHHSDMDAHCDKIAYTASDLLSEGGLEESDSEEEDLKTRLCPDCICVHHAYTQIELDAQHRVATAEEEARKWRASAVDLAERIQSLVEKDSRIKDVCGMLDLLKSSGGILSDAIDES